MIRQAERLEKQLRSVEESLKQQNAELQDRITAHVQKEVELASKCDEAGLKLRTAEQEISRLNLELEHNGQSEASQLKKLAFFKNEIQARTEEMAAVMVEKEKADLALLKLKTSLADTEEATKVTTIQISEYKGKIALLTEELSIAKEQLNEDQRESLQKQRDIAYEKEEFRKVINELEILLAAEVGTGVVEKFQSRETRVADETATMQLALKNEAWRAHQAEQEVGHLKEELQQKFDLVLELQSGMAALDQALQTSQGGIKDGEKVAEDYMVKLAAATEALHRAEQGALAFRRCVSRLSSLHLCASS